MIKKYVIHTTYKEELFLIKPKIYKMIFYFLFLRISPCQIQFALDLRPCSLSLPFHCVQLQSFPVQPLPTATRILLGKGPKEGGLETKTECSVTERWLQDSKYRRQEPWAAGYRLKKKSILYLM